MRFKAALLLSSILIPVATVAYFSNPYDAIRSLNFEGKRVGFTVEAQVHGEEGASFPVKGALQLRGEVQGTTTKNLKANVKLSAQLLEGKDSMFIRMQIKVVNQVAYFMVERISNTKGTSPLGLLDGLKPRTWYSYPLTAEQFEQQTGKDSEEVEAMVKDVVNAFFSISRTSEGDGSVYSLKMKPTAVEELLKVAQKYAEDEEIAGLYADEMTASGLKELLAPFNIHLKISTDADDTATGYKYYLSYITPPFEGTGITAVLNGNSRVKSGTMNVVAPKKFVPFSEMANESVGILSPTTQLKEARDDMRRSDINALINAVYQYAIDNNGSLPNGITLTKKEICSSLATSCNGFVDLSTLKGSYLVDIPSDPEIASTEKGTGYLIFQDRNGRITVSSKMNPDISVTR